MNEIRVDGADAPITGLLRHGSSLLAFKPDGTWSITYSPPDAAGWHGYRRVLPAASAQEPGQLCHGAGGSGGELPRTVTPGALYDWQLPEGYHRDERQAQLASGAVGDGPAGNGSLERGGAG